MGFSGARGEFKIVACWHICKYRRLGCDCRLLGWAKAKACLRAEGDNITSISRLPPYAAVADAGAGCLWARMYMLRNGFHEDSLVGIYKVHVDSASFIFIHPLSRTVALFITNSVSRRSVRSVPDPQHCRSLDHPVQAPPSNPHLGKQKEGR